MIQLATLVSPIGPLTIAVREAKLCVLHFGAAHPPVVADLGRWYPTDEICLESNDRVARALDQYFAGQLTAIDALDVEFNGTPFQVKVWNALRTVPAGSTRSYGEIAKQIGLPAAVRAVGAANGANPVAVVVPCHRVIGSNGSLTGYGGGLDRKRWLLRHESGALF